eukprot:NODE_3092_length_706_cov_448.774734_g2185_i0.p1 GENE.NODE_3092_length_706_cov_448.774734_g2185_i0~~NODE_3092_length_706_cov_448.774734_g2185_i0.p1  ORF type:complete len:167 (+),score=73.66 NODE_3092_length_706_cov_448.774734_g2185_i0:66-503(+)
MPFIPHVFEENVFNIIKLAGDPDLQERIKKRDTNFQAVRDTITVPQKFNKMVELVQTRRDIWYISDDKWKVTCDLHEPGEVKRSPGTLQFYAVPELNHLCTTMIDLMVAKYAELKDRYFLRIQITEFSDKDTEGSEVSLKISYFP